MEEMEAPVPPQSAAVASVTSELGKLFVGGVSSETREEALAEHFGEYGEVKEAVVMRDRATGNTRGFGFVQFADPDAAEQALKADKHVIRGRAVEVKRAIPRGDQNQTHKHGSYSPQQGRTPSRSITNNNSNRGNYNNGNSSNNSYGGHYNLRKIFVGGLPDSISEEDFSTYFEKFGKVTDTVIMYDNITHRPRGFGFISFDSTDAVDTVLKNNYHELNGKMVEVKIAVPKDGNNNSNSNNNNNGINADNNIQSSRNFIGKGYSFGGHQDVFYPHAPRYGHIPNPFPSYDYYSGGGYMMTGGYMNGYGGMGYGVPLPSPRAPWALRWSPTPYSNTSNYWGMTNGHSWVTNSGDNTVNEGGVPDIETATGGNSSSSQVEGVALNAQ